MERPWPFTGRDEELRRVAAALRPGAAGIVVAGAAGVGKTRLVREALALVAVVARRGGAGPGRGGPPIVWAQGSAAARPLPLGAFAGALDLPPGEPVDTVGRALRHLAELHPAIVAVDDAHLLDEHSAILVHRVVTRGIAPVVVALRTGGAPPDLVTALWKDEHLARLDLVPLDAAATTELVARAVGGPVESASARRLWTLVEGSPLFLRHVLPDEVAAGRFAPRSGLWRWEREPAFSSELLELLEVQIGRLQERVRDALDLVALGEPIPLRTLAGLTSPLALEEAEERGLVRADAGLARLAHPLYGEVRRAAMGRARARRLRGVIAGALDASEDPIRRAVLTLDSDLPEDSALFLRAAEAALRIYDLPLAERLARAASAAGNPGARMVHAAALSWLSRGVEAEAILVELAGEGANPEIRAMAHLHRAGNLLWTLARAGDAAAALALAEASGGAPAHVVAMGLALAAAVGDLPRVWANGPALLREQLPDDLARILVASAVAAAAAVRGDAALLEEAAIVGGFTQESVPTVIPGFGLADFQVLGHRLLGAQVRADDLARRLRVASADLPGPAALMGLVVAGHAALAGGRLADAIVLLREAWAGLGDSGHEFRFRCRTLLATALAQAGEAAAATALLADRASHPAYRLFEPDDLLARAWAAAAEGALSSALELAGRAATLARATGAPACEALAWQTAVQFGDGEAAVERLAQLAGATPRAQVALRHARALVSGDTEALEALVGDWCDLGDLVAAGDAAAQCAVLHRAAGRPGSALAAAARAAALADRSGARTPALVAAGRPLPLTRREREVVTLAAHGLTNKNIAERLTLSVRTVEGHLYRACQKLGVTDRASLGGVLGIG